jgi:hypothetical protein
VGLQKRHSDFTKLSTQILDWMVPASAVEVRDETEKRAAHLFERVDPHLAGGSRSAAEIVCEALENGASTADDFASAFKQAGLKPEIAKAVGEAVESHLRLARFETANEIAEMAKDTRAKIAAAENQTTTFHKESKITAKRGRSRLQWFLIGCAALVLFVPPWRFVSRSQGHVRVSSTWYYSPIFYPPWDGYNGAEIDLTRYAVQIFSLSAFVAFLWFMRRNRGL